MKIPRTRSLVRSAALVELVALVALVACHFGSAATQYASGSLTWDNASTAAWSATPGGPYASLWTSGNDAVFEGAFGTVGISSPTAHNLTFNTTGYILSGASTLTLNGTAPTISLGTGISATISAAITGSAGLTKAGAGTLTIGGANTYSGTTTIKGGTLQLGNGGGSLNGTAGTDLTFDATGTFNVKEAAASTQGMGVLTLNAGDASVTSTAAGASSAATLTLASMGARTAGATASFTLATNTTAATNKIVLSDTTNAPLNGSGSNNPGILFSLNGNSAAAGYARYDTGTGYFRATSYGVDNNSVAAIATTATTMGVNDATKDVSITAANPGISAQTTASVNTIRTTNAVTIVAGNTLSVNGIMLVTGNTSRVVGPNTSFLQPTSDGGELVLAMAPSVATATGALQIASIIQNYSGGSSPTSLTKAGIGTVTLQSANTFSGVTKINNGTLRMVHSLALQNSILDTSGAGVVDMTLAANTFGGLTGAKDLTLPAAVTGLSLKPGTGVTATYSGALGSTTPGMTLTKSGAGTQVFAGPNTYTGLTTITVGTLALSGSGAIASGTIDIQSSAVLDVSALSGGWTVGGSQTLKGNGTLIGSATSSGSVAPGASVGTLNVTGGFTFASGSTLNAEIAGGTAQVETATAVATATASGDVAVTVTNTAGTLASLTVPVLVDDTADIWAGKVRTALQADSAVTALFSVGGSGAAITLTRLTAAANDAVLNIALANGTSSPSITPAATSANTSAGVAPGGTDLLAVSGALNVTGGTLNLAITGTLTAPAYVIATYGSGLLTGTFTAITGSAIPSGYELDYAYSGGTAIAIKQSAGDTTPPAWAATFPKVDTATTSGFTVRAQVNEAGTCYFVVVANGAGTPSAAQVKAGQDSTNSTALAAGSFALIAATPNRAVAGGLAPGTTYDVWFTAEDVSSNTQGPTLVSAITLTTFADWISGFSVGGLTGLTDDPDHDGIKNFLEFALNSNPADGGSAGRTFVKMATVSAVNNVLTLTVAVRNGAAAFGADGNNQKAPDATDSLTYIIEAANTLADWGTPVVSQVTGSDATTIQLGLPALGSGWSYQTFRTDGSSSSDPADFIRIKVTTP